MADVFELVDDLWDLEASVTEDLPYGAYYPRLVSSDVTPEPPPVVGLGGGGGYAPFLIPVQPREYCYTMSVELEVEAWATPHIRTEPLPPQAPPLVVRPPRRTYRPQVQGAEGVISVSHTLRRLYTLESAGAVFEVEASAGVTHRDWVRDVVRPDDEDLLDIL